MFSTLLPLLALSSLVVAQGVHHATYNYRDVHAYPANATFDARDGWDRVLVSDLDYKYKTKPAEQHVYTRSNRTHHLTHARRKAKSSKKPSSSNNLFDSALAGIGQATSVVITWYTGNDLKNPSCWANGEWAPTDESFACALTLEGWTTRPKCFSFLELCNGPQKCIFVRVVDTCAGCKKGSKHVDLTKAAFTKLAPLDQGLLNVNMRLATAPKKWDAGLWGPKN